MRVNIQAAFAQEADQGLTVLLGELDGQAGGSGDGSDDGKTGGEGFLHDLESHASADEQDAFGVGGVFQQAVADDFVQGVVAADVLAQGEEFS